MFSLQDLSLFHCLFVTRCLTLTLSPYTINKMPKAVRSKLKPLLLTSSCLRSNATACHWGNTFTDWVYSVTSDYKLVTLGDNEENIGPLDPIVIFGCGKKSNLHPGFVL